MIRDQDDPISSVADRAWSLTIFQDSIHCDRRVRGGQEATTSALRYSTTTPIGPPNSEASSDRDSYQTSKSTLKKPKSANLDAKPQTGG